MNTPTTEDLGPKQNNGLKLALTLALTTFAFAPILVRISGEVDAIALATVRTVSAVTILAPLWYFFQVKYVVSFYSSKDNFYAALAGLCLGLHFILWISSLSYTSVASASVLVTCHPVILILFEATVFKRIFIRRVWFGVFTAFTGSALLGYTDSSAVTDYQDPLLGNAMALSAALLFAGYFLISQRLRQKSDWLNYIFRVYGFSAIACVAISIFLDVNFEMSKEAWLVGIGLAIGPQIIGHGTMNFAVRSISPTFLSTLILAEPIGASLLALILFAEMPPPLSLLALAVIMTGIILTWKTKM
ncbi:MAG: DMT family transporter [Balneolales bacterium]